ncbi:uncharacterized protein LOC101743535 isoform X2 [Bombyx mori]|uniref:Receptor ligand binding region domain-containing protein n=1 Tax=Bombyx mori TaxID=7091 RepID=A0A8R2C5M3_BOMMO|nr:uncharacterized protein LOC101743535 isoform X2 [Bombyx mori]
MVTTSITILRFPSVFRNSEPRLWLASKQYCRLKMQTSCYSKVIIILAFILVHSVELQNFKENPVNKIILLESKNAPPYAQYMYKNLHNVFNRFKIKFEIIYRSKADVETTIKITKLNRNSTVINIYVDDFYKTNYDEIRKNNLLYAGDIDLNTSTLLINNGVIRNRNYVTEPQPARKIAKLMTANIARMKELEQYICGFPNKKLSIDIDKKPNKVLICLNKFNVHVKHVLHFSDDIGLNLIYSDKCEEDIKTHKETILAVLTPKQIESDLASPIIIYENSQQDYYDSSNVFNVVNLKKSMEFFEIGFKSFLKETYWNRVAVISDTWAYSLMFQDMLTTMFKKEGILHTALECFENVHGIIDFKPALRKLRAADAGIVIVNIDKRNGMQLAKQVQQVMKLNGIVWVSRDWPFEEDVSTEN